MPITFADAWDIVAKAGEDPKVKHLLHDIKIPTTEEEVEERKEEVMRYTEDDHRVIEQLHQQFGVNIEDLIDCAAVGVRQIYEQSNIELTTIEFVKAVTIFKWAALIGACYIRENSFETSNIVDLLGIE